MSSADAQIRAIVRAKIDRESSGNVINGLMAEMKISLVCQIDWVDILQTCPVSLVSMGACFSAGSSTRMTPLKLNPPRAGFRYLRFGESLKANLIETGDLGRAAFTEAEAGMGLIQHTGPMLNKKIIDLIHGITDPESALESLKPQLATIHDGAQKCLEALKHMDKKFEDWLLFACELHAACVALDPAMQEVITSREFCVAAEQARLDHQQSTVEQAEKASTLLEKQLSLAWDAYREVSSKIPSGYDIMGQEIVQDLVQSAATALNASIPALVDTLNPIKGTGTANDVVGAFLHSTNSVGDAKSVSTNRESQFGHPRLSPVPVGSLDPAYSEVLRVTAYLTAVNGILHGKNDDIDWNKATGGSSDAGKKSRIQFLVEILDFHAKSFQTVATKAEPSLTLTNILGTTHTIVSQIAAEAAKAKDSRHSLPKRSSTIVQKWHSDFREQYQKANILASTARSLPGSLARGTPVLASSQLQSANIDAQTSQAQAMLESASIKFTTTEKFFATSHENYSKTTNLVSEQRNKLTEIHDNLMKITASDITLSRVKAILIESLKLILHLKQRIGDLVRSFKALTVIIDITTKVYATPFLQMVRAMITGTNSDSDNIKIAGITLIDLQRTILYSAIVTIYAYSNVFMNIGEMWKQLSVRTLTPGLEICDRCQQLATFYDEAGPEVRRMVQNFQAWSKEASTDVAQVAEKAQKDNLGSIQKCIEGIQNTTRQIEAPPEATLKAITAGTDATKQAVAKYIESKNDQSALVRFGHVDHENV